jgi:AraC-like DNA-binding protein
MQRKLNTESSAETGTAPTDRTPFSPTRISAWRVRGMLFERYDYWPGRVEPLPRHFHDDYQLGYSEHEDSPYRYRGIWHTVAPGAISVISPGEAHMTRQNGMRSAQVTYRMMYIPTELLKSRVGDGGSLPFFPNLVIADEEIARHYAGLHQVAEQGASILELDVRLSEMLHLLLQRHVRDRPCLPGAPRTVKPGLRRAREYLHGHFEKAVSLATLSEIAGMSPFHFSRSFTRLMGVPPHAYQTQLRIERAKRLLCEGRHLVDVSCDLGFADQSHFTRHFRKLVGCAPGRYTARSDQPRQNTRAFCQVRPGS